MENGNNRGDERREAGDEEQTLGCLLSRVQERNLQQAVAARVQERNKIGRREASFTAYRREASSYRGPAYRREASSYRGLLYRVFSLLPSFSGVQSFSARASLFSTAHALFFPTRAIFSPARARPFPACHFPPARA
jgi:hypothetical protein